jgi:hypothetical protein
MEKIKTFVRETNGLAIISLLAAISAWTLILINLLIDLGWVYDNYRWAYNLIDTVEGPTLLGVPVAVLLGIVALIWLKIKKQKGEFIAILGIAMGTLAFFFLLVGF